MEVWKIIFLSKWVIGRFHVNLPGCRSNFTSFRLEKICINAITHNYAASLQTNLIVEMSTDTPVGQSNWHLVSIGT